MARIVAALGGNALGSTVSEQQERVYAAACALAELAAAGHELAVTHGNGPQVGMISNAFGGQLPFSECGAMSQGYIGYHLQNALDRALSERGVNKSAVTVVTRVEVDGDDPAFHAPTKPIGGFLTQEQAHRAMERDPSLVYTEDSGRGWRRVVPSPMPVDIVEKDAIRELSAQGHIVIACGGGGIPVIKRGGIYAGTAAVIDKDYAGEKLAELLDAEVLLILTAVDGSYLHYHTPDQRFLSSVSVEEARRYASEGHFAPGSMLPKVLAGCAFAASQKGRTAIIAALDKTRDAMNGRSGTIIKG